MTTLRIVRASDPASLRSTTDDREQRRIVAKWLTMACRAKRLCRMTPVSRRSVTISLELAEKIAAWIGEEAS